MQRNRKMLGSRVSRRGSKNQGRGGSRLSSVKPPEIVSTVCAGHTFRFLGSTAGTAIPVSRANLLNLMSMATTTTNQFRVLSAIKIKRVTLWNEPVALGGAPVAASIEWSGSDDEPSTIHSDTALGVRPAFVSTVPPKQSLAAFWSTSGASNEADILFFIRTASTAVVDIQCSLRYVDDEIATASENGTAAGSAVGTIYFHPLDGFASGLLPASGGVRVLP